jgi:hypothetical protein
LNRTPEENFDEGMVPNAIEPEAQEQRPRFQDVFASFPLFDDLYLRMQAMNLDIVDEFLDDQEASLLRQYIEIPKSGVKLAILMQICP